jgi:pyruvate dehydrogenase E2 component (dihydrolipoamide acetyltransferase)
MTDRLILLVGGARVPPSAPALVGQFTMRWLARNVALAGPLELSPWRRLALVAWDSVSDASVPGAIELDAEPLLRFMEAESRRAGRPVRLIHCVGKAVGEMLRRMPDINCLIRWGRLYRRRDVDLFFPVAMDRRGQELSGVVLRRVDTLSLAEVAEALSRAAYRLRKHGERAFAPIKSGPLGPLVLRAGGFILYTLNLWSPVLGLPRDPFGGAAITDLSRFDIEYAFPPLLPFARLPLVVGVGPLVEAWVAPGRAVPRLRICAVFDHRVIDGVYAARMFALLKTMLSAPEQHLVRHPVQ